MKYKNVQRGTDNEMDILKASEKLSQLDLKLDLDNYIIDILWFRAMLQRHDWKIKRHTHSSFEFHYVKSGQCRVSLDDSEFIASEGEFYITAPGVYHEQMSYKNDVYVEYSLNCDIKPKTEENIKEKNSEIYYILNILLKSHCKIYRDSYGIIAAFNEALEEALYERSGFYNYIKSLVTIIITKTSRIVAEDEPKLMVDIPRKVTKEDARYRLISKFIEDNVQNAISTVDIAQYMHLSDKQVCRIVKSKTGGSTKELINDIKFDKAKELLKSTNLNQKEIASQLGFSSEYYFNQFFRKREGDTPGNFRANIINV